MAESYVGEVRMFGGNFAPTGWAFCDGQLLAISEFEALFNLIGTTYGGDGMSTFGLPDLRSRTPIHQGQGTGLSSRIIGEMGGQESVALTVQQTPGHGHAAVAAAVTGDQTSLSRALPANSVTITPYANTAPDSPFNAASIGPAGASQPHDNVQPYLCVSFIISLFGIYPSPT
jgi:microcystin-dependent protein